MYEVPPRDTHPFLREKEVRWSQTKTLQHMVLWSLAWLTKRVTTTAQLSPVTLNHSLPLQSNGGMNEHKVLYQPLNP